MTYTYNPIGFCVLESQNPAADLAYWRQLKPYSMTFSQRVFGLVKQAHDTIPELKVIILRTVLDNEGEKTLHQHGDYVEMVRAFKAFVKDNDLDYNRVYLNIGCEPDLRGTEAGAILQWTVDAMRYAKSQGVRCAVLGVGMATLEDYHWLSGTFNGLVQELKDHWHVLAIHTYYGPIAYAGAGGQLADVYLSAELAQEKYAPSRYDVQIGSIQNNWFIGRMFNGVLLLCKLLGIPYPRMIATEHGPDRMHNLEWVELSTGEWVNIFSRLESVPFAREVFVDGEFKWLKVPWPHWGMRGWNTLRWVWESYYPDLTPGQVLAKFTSWYLWLHDRENDPPYLEAVQLFAWCPGHDEWDIQHGFDMSKDASLHQALQDYSDAIDTTPPDTEPEPEPPIDWLKVIGLAAGLFILSLILILGGIILLSNWKATHASSLASGGYNTMDMNDLLQQLFAIPAFAVVSYTAGIVWFMVEMWKRYIVVRLPEQLKAAPETVALILIGLFMAVHGLAVEYQYDTALKQVAQFLTDLVNVLGPYVLGGVVTSAVTNYAYNKLRDNKAPGFNAVNPTPKK